MTWKINVWILVLCTVLAVAGAVLVSTVMWVCADGKTFVKEWTGNLSSVEGNVTVTDLAGHVWFNGSIPQDHKIVIHNVPHGTVFMIQWKDWRGVHNERWVVECENDISYLKNDIPYPKSAQPTTFMVTTEDV